MKRTLKQLIESKGTNSRRFAESIGVSASTIYNINQGARDINGLAHSTYRKIANGLGMSSDELHDWLEGED